MERPVSDMARDRLPRVTRGELDYESMSGEMRAGLVRSRRVFRAVVVVLALVALVVVVTGATDAAIGMTIALTLPVAAIGLVVEVLAWWMGGHAPAPPDDD